MRSPRVPAPGTKAGQREDHRVPGVRCRGQPVEASQWVRPNAGRPGEIGLEKVPRRVPVGLPNTQVLRGEGV